MSAREVHQGRLRTPFYSRLAALDTLNTWHNWKGYTVPDALYCADTEYFAIRNATGVFDLTPMTKYRISGPDALVVGGYGVEAATTRFDLELNVRVVPDAILGRFCFNTDVLDAAFRLSDAQSREVRALADYQIAKVDLAFATGTLLGKAKLQWEPTRMSDVFP